MTACDNCLWGDKCRDERGTCEDYVPLEGDIAELEYEKDLRMRVAEYKKVVAEQQGLMKKRCR